MAHRRILLIKISQNEEICHGQGCFPLYGSIRNFKHFLLKSMVRIENNLAEIVTFRKSEDFDSSKTWLSLAFLLRNKCLPFAKEAEMKVSNPKPTRPLVLFFSVNPSHPYI